MGYFGEVDQWLRTHEHPNASGGRLEDLSRLVGQFDTGDWEDLGATWPQRPRNWCLRLLAAARQPALYARWMPILVRMILASDIRLAAEAADALADVVERVRILDPHPMDVSLALPGRLDELQAGGGGRALHRLKRRLGHAYSW